MRSWLIVCLLLASMAGYGAEIAVTQDAEYDPALPVGSLYHISFLHDATTFVNGISAISELIDISYERYSVASIQVSRNSATAGAISTATFEIFLSLTEDRESPVFNLAPANASDTSAWIPLITITNYGIYNLPLGAARYLRIIAYGVDNVARRVDIGLR